MHDTPCTSTLDCKMDQLKALLSAAIDLTCPSSVPDMATVRGVLYAAQDVAQAAGAIAERLESDYTVVPA